MNDTISLRDLFVFFVIVLIFLGNVWSSIREQRRKRRAETVPEVKGTEQIEVSVPPAVMARSRMGKAVTPRPEEIELEIEEFPEPVPKETGLREPALHRRRCGHRHCLSRRQLRRAIVWAEIVAPPVSLRDER